MEASWTLPKIPGKHSEQHTCNDDVEKCSGRLLTLWLEGHVRQKVLITWKMFTEAITDACLEELTNNTNKLTYYLLTSHNLFLV